MKLKCCYLVCYCIDALLGAGESGKSTILKQMKLLHDNGFSNEEKEAFKEIIFSNLIASTKVLIEAMARLNIPMGTQKTKQTERLFKTCLINSTLLRFRQMFLVP